MTERRDTLVRAFGRRGFRTIALMPGLRQRWPEGAFYGFERIYGADELQYRGPEFGWFAIPDQFSLLKLDEREPPGDRPRFVFFPTISTHFPFSPTPPYQPDWRRMNDEHPYDAAEIVRAYAREPNWTDFEPDYVRAIAYDLAAIGGFLQRHAGGDEVVILVGDHQPPALVSGEGARWDVPVHVVTRRADVLERLAASGFIRGLTPSQSLGGMHTLAPLLLDAFALDGHRAASVVLSN
jgi:hypothetical protein